MNTTLVSNQQLGSSTKGLNVLLWISQIILALMFGFAGIMKLITPIEQLTQSIEWSSGAPFLIRFIGLSELLGAIGLLLPALTRIKPQLTTLAAAGLAVVMVLATLFHLVRGEISAIGITLLLGGLATFVVWGRSKKVPIQSRK